MRYALLALPLLVSGVFGNPIPKRALDDTTILNFALTLEHLESAFYSEGLGQFSQAAFKKARLPNFARGRFEQVAEHEKAHVVLLEKVLGDKAVKPCTYKFPFKDAKSFSALAAALEGVGTSAYAGAAQFVSDKTLLTAAATILSTEGRHTSWIRSAVNKGSGWSGAFDVALGLNQVFTLAAQFIDKCPPTNPPLPFKPFPALAFSSPVPGSTATLTFTAPDSGSLFVAFLSGLDKIFVPVKKKGEDLVVEVPKELRGVVYALVVKKADSISDEDVVAGPAILDIEFDSQARLVTQ